MNGVTLEAPIGLLGGTFDPVHLGHLWIARRAYELLGLREIRFIPCHQNALKSESPHATPAQRVAMLKLALGNIPGMVIDDREIYQKGFSYTIESLRAIRKELRQIHTSEVPLCLLMSSDVFSRFYTWKEWQSILDFTHLVVLPRPELNTPLVPILHQLLDACQVSNRHMLYKQAAGKILVLPIDRQQPISSTFIRELIRKGKNVQEFLPPEVGEYMEYHHIY